MIGRCTSGGGDGVLFASAPSRRTGRYLVLCMQHWRHVHAYDYVVVPVTDGRTDVITPDGTVTSAQLRAGESYGRPAGGEQEVVNAGTTSLAFVEIELKQQAP